MVGAFLLLVLSGTFALAHAVMPKPLSSYDRHPSAMSSTTATSPPPEVRGPLLSGDVAADGQVAMKLRRGDQVTDAALSSDPHLPLATTELLRDPHLESDAPPSTPEGDSGVCTLQMQKALAAAVRTPGLAERHAALRAALGDGRCVNTQCPFHGHTALTVVSGSGDSVAVRMLLARHSQQQPAINLDLVGLSVCQSVGGWVGRRAVARLLNSWHEQLPNRARHKCHVVGVELWPFHT